MCLLPVIVETTLIVSVDQVHFSMLGRKTIARLSEQIRYSIVTIDQNLQMISHRLNLDDNDLTLTGGERDRRNRGSSNKNIKGLQKQK
jgi:hypothetical protein